MMTDYEVREAFWRRGNLVEAGETVTLSDAEAKYLGHALETVAEAEKRRAREARDAERAAEKAAAEEPAEAEEGHPRRRAKAS